MVAPLLSDAKRLTAPDPAPMGGREFHSCPLADAIAEYCDHGAS